jgi:hypothetical protein
MDETQGYTATFKSQITGKSVNLRFSIDRGMDSNPFLPVPVSKSDMGRRRRYRVDWDVL